MLKGLNRNKREALTLIAVFIVVLIGSALVTYLITSRTHEPAAPAVGQSRDQAATPESTARPPVAESREAEKPAAESPVISSPRSEDPLFDSLFGSPQTRAPIAGDTWTEVAARITLRLVFAALLGAVLAFRPRRRLQLMKPNPYVAQSQILLAVVAAALMIVVGDNVARAFGIFAAVSLVRFRTNIRDPKEITVLLISLAVGLGAGVGRWDLALVLAVFSLIVLYILEYKEPEQVFRSMELKVATRNVAATQGALRQVLKKHHFDSELRTLNRENGDDHMGSLVYSVDVSPVTSTDELSEEIMALDGRNVDAIEWTQKKSFSYVYQ